LAFQFQKLSLFWLRSVKVNSAVLPETRQIDTVVRLFGSRAHPGRVNMTECVAGRQLTLTE
jgi:hypothetical protein